MGDFSQPASASSDCLRPVSRFLKLYCFAFLAISIVSLLTFQSARAEESAEEPRVVLRSSESLPEEIEPEEFAWPTPDSRAGSQLPLVRRETTLNASEPYIPPNSNDRIEWMLGRTFGWRSITTGAIQSGIKTWRNTPEEWGSDLDGFGKRFGTRQADVLISGAVEASLGSLWGEDPRYWRAGKDGAGPRLWHAVSSAFLTYREDGSRNFAWARLIGNVSGDAVVRRWYPDGERDWYKWTLTPLGTGWVGKIFSNVFREFSPDLKRAFSGKKDKRRDQYLKKDP